MIEKVKLKNFRQHKDTVLEFIPGINTIVGENNSGKSSIPEAIEFALYGSRALRDSAKGYITDGEQEGSAVIKLDVADNSYTVGRNSKNAEIKKNGELESQYKDNVSRDVALITGVNQTGFRLGHYVRQKELTAFSSMRPGKRHETIEKMLKVNAVDKAIELVKKELSDVETNQKFLLTSYTDVIAVENELDDLYIVKQALVERGKSFTDYLVSIKDILEGLRVSQTERAALVVAKERNDKQLAKWDTDCLIAKDAAIELDNTQILLSKLDWSLYDSVKSTIDKLHIKEIQHAKMSSIKKELDQELLPIDEVLKPIEPDKGPWQAIGALVTVKRTQIRNIKALVDKACCPTCNTPLTNITETIAQLNKELEDLQKEEHILSGELGLETQNYNIANNLYSNYMANKAVYNEKMLRRVKLLEEYVEVVFDADEKKRYEEELKELQANKEEAIRLQGEIKRLTPLAIEPERPDVFVGIIGPDESERLAELEKLNTEINENFREQASELAHTDSRIAELQRLIDKNKVIKESIDTNANLIADLKGEQDAFVMFKRYLTAKIRPMLQEVAEALFHKVTKNRYASYQLGSDYDISFTTHRGYYRKLSTISGSENDLACLCLRLAIATLRSTRLAGSLGFVILDEISGSFDDERTRQTLEGLIELKDVIPQIINITHKPVEMKYADRLFKVTETNGLASVTFE